MNKRCRHLTLNQRCQIQEELSKRDESGKPQSLRLACCGSREQGRSPALVSMRRQIKRSGLAETLPRAVRPGGPGRPAQSPAPVGQRIRLAS